MEENERRQWPSRTTWTRVMRWLWVWGPVALMMIAIFVMSSVPDLTELPGGVTDKTGHFIGYALLATFTLRALAHVRWARVTAASAFWAWTISAVYGVTDELHQGFVHGRSQELADWAADVCGAGAAVLTFYLVARVVSRGRAGKRAV